MYINMGTQNPGARSPWRLKLYGGHQYRTSFMSPFRNLNSEVATRFFFGKYVHPPVDMSCIHAN